MANKGNCFHNWAFRPEEYEAAYDAAVCLLLRKIGVACQFYRKVSLICNDYVPQSEGLAKQSWAPHKLANEALELNDSVWYGSEGPCHWDFHIESIGRDAGGDGQYSSITFRANRVHPIRAGWLDIKQNSGNEAEAIVYPGNRRRLHPTPESH